MIEIFTVNFFGHHQLEDLFAVEKTLEDGVTQSAITEEVLLYLMRKELLGAYPGSS